MFKFLKRCRCKHEYTKTTTKSTERVLFDRVTTTCTVYRCIHCNYTFKVIDEVAKIPIPHIHKTLNMVMEEKRERRTITTRESLRNIKPLKTDKE